MIIEEFKTAAPFVYGVISDENFFDANIQSVTNRDVSRMISNLFMCIMINKVDEFGLIIYNRVIECGLKLKLRVEEIENLQ
jgi:hypothetical protein